MDKSHALLVKIADRPALTSAVSPLLTARMAIVSLLKGIRHDCEVERCDADVVPLRLGTTIRRLIFPSSNAFRKSS
jgi:hypothetical protein